MSSYPRVLHVVRHLGYGGLEMGVVNVIQGLMELGFVQAVCCLEERGDLADRLPASVPVWSCARRGAAERVPWRAAGLIRSWRPDVVHARNGAAWIDATAAWLLSGRHGCLAFSAHGWDRLDPVPRRRAFLFRQLARFTSGMAAVSAETARQFAAETGIPEERFQVLSSGIDTARFRPAEHRLPRGRLVLGCVSRLDPVKAHDVMIDAFARLVHDDRRDLELRLLGDGPRRTDLEQLVQRLRLDGRVIVRGMVSDIPGELRELDVFVLSSHREGRPTSIMEAMASGLPVVATCVGAIPQLVEPGRTGLLVEPGDSAALARALRTVIDDEPLRKWFAQEARDVALANLSLQRMVRDYAQFYNGLAGVVEHEAAPARPLSECAPRGYHHR